jgi:hypothetical protein
MKKRKAKEPPRRGSVSVTGATYRRLKDAIGDGSMGNLVDELVTKWLDEQGRSV